MRVVVEIFGVLREKLGWKRKIVELEGNSASLNHLLDKLPELRNIVTEEGRLREGVLILINGIHVQHLKGLETPLKDGDEVSVFPPGGGGL